MGEDKWISLKEQPAPIHEPVFFLQGTTQKRFVKTLVEGSHAELFGFTHWQPVEFPDPPKAEVVYECPFCGAHSVFACHIAAGMFQAKCAACCAKGSVEDGEAAAMAHFAVKEG